ncbi:T9SS type A sorting domain-containing protein [Neptunitalea lumnitzerae]|uniref:Secretion system C-terminal sorting domain-containing protein n=1 Tax=Neptunitalea lumnitzerae TaxID=2965509 RepID=A0ABQ5MFV8_9FLAO|nr:T9SS type A sorting domain-containing protein [Neptunitalea sp. Y10]GLB48306.1 hypothetical protein Y10_06740 [Neptunitalea sp. Y10]
MIKNLLSLCLLSLLTYLGSAQCATDAYITTNYLDDAKILALREILSDPADPDYNNPEIPVARYQPYLEGLSVIYANANNNQVTDSMFNEFAIHAIPGNPNFSTPMAYNSINIRIPNNTPWLTTFKTTGVSGDSTLDNLMTTYNFSISNFNDLNSCNCTWFVLESTDILNVEALIDDFTAVTDISFAEAATSVSPFNYTGIAYTIDDAWGTSYNVEATNITVNNNIYTFWLYGGDCWSGCIASKSYEFQLNNDCTYTPMKTDSSELATLEVYPNPTTDFLQVKVSDLTSVENITIYNINGTLIATEKNNTRVNVSNYAPGMYFIKIVATSGASTTKKFIKL